MAGPELAQQYRYIASACLLHYAQSPVEHTRSNLCTQHSICTQRTQHHQLGALDPKHTSSVAVHWTVHCVPEPGGSDPSCACSHQIVETEHLMKALLEQPNGLARRIIAKAGSNPSMLLERTEEFIRQQPKVSGSSDQVQLVMGP